MRETGKRENVGLGSVKATVQRDGGDGVATSLSGVYPKSKRERETTTPYTGIDLSTGGVLCSRPDHYTTAAVQVGLSSSNWYLYFSMKTFVLCPPSGPPSVFLQPPLPPVGPSLLRRPCRPCAGSRLGSHEQRECAARARARPCPYLGLCKRPDITWLTSLLFLCPLRVAVTRRHKDHRGMPQHRRR